MSHTPGWPERHRALSGRTVKVQLVREPDNPADPNAVRVDGPDGPLGWVPSVTAASVAAVLDVGWVVEAWATVQGDEHPGVVLDAAVMAR